MVRALLGRCPWLGAIASLMLAVLCVHAAAFAQPKPDPPPPPPPPPPPQVDYATFRQAYENAGRPVTMVLVGYSLAGREKQSIEDSLWSLDPTGFGFQLRSAFNEFLNAPEVDVELVSDAALKDSVARLGKNLDLRRERESIELLAAQAKADLIISINLTRVAPNDQRPARGQMTVTNSRGRELMNWPFDWNAGTDIASVRDMARRFVIAFTNDYSRRVAAPTRWTVRVFDLNDPETILSVREAMESTRGIKRVQLRRADAGRTDAVREFEVTTSLDPLELEVVVTRGLKAFNLVAETIKVEGQAVNIRARKPKTDEPKRETVQACIEVMTDKDSEQGKNVRARLLNLYNSQRQPSVAVLVNRRPSSPGEIRRAEAAAGGGGVAAQTVILVSGTGGVNQVGPGAGGDAQKAPAPGNAGANADEEFRTISVRNNLHIALEGHLYNMLGSELLDFNRRVEPNKVRLSIIEAAKQQNDIYNEAALSQQLRASKVADLFLEGTGTMELTQAGYKARYSFFLATIDGRRIAEAPDIQREGALEDKDGLKDMAREALAKMACQLLAEWSKDPQVQITLNGVTDNSDWLTFSRVAGESTQLFRIVGNPIDSKYGPSNGFVKFTITFKAGVSQSEIETEFQRLNEKLPFRLVAEGGTFVNGLTYALKAK